MAREEAAEILSGVNIVETKTHLEAIEVAASALIESAQQAPAKLDRSRWEGCELCKGVTGWTQDLDDEHHEVDF